MTRTRRQLRGARAEALAADWLRSTGWQVIASNVRLRRDEIDLVAVDPGPPPELVAVEVRSASSWAFGAPEERVDHAKVAHLYRALRGLAVAAVLPAHVRRLPKRVDLVIVDQRPGPPEIRHLRSLEPT